MKNPIDAAIGRARMVLLSLVLLLVAGAYAYINIPKESSPDINVPYIYVSMSLEGISPEDSERLLLRPVEEELTGIEGVKEMTATAYQGGGFVLLEFVAGFNKDKAMDDVQKAVDRIRPELPDGVDEPRVTEVNFSLFPVLVVTLSGPVEERALMQLARRLKDNIQALPPILEANIAGEREELVEIVVRPELIEAYNLNGPEIVQFFSASNRLVAAGNLDTGAGRFAIEVPGLFKTVYDLMEMPVLTQGDSVVKMRDIADIRRTFKDPENFARLNGEKAIAIEVVKRSGENIIDTIAAVRAVVERERAFWPDGVEVNYTQDTSNDIRIMLSDLQNNMISAVLLVMIVIVAALGVRAAGLVGVAVPGAFLTGVLVIYMMGLTVNVVVLFSLIMSVGMLVDGAVVVVELADRKMAEGLHRKQAYALASRRMAWPIIASTATTLAAFAPLLFWPGLVGEFMKYLPLTLIAVLSASLLMALVFVPVLGALFGKPGAAASPELLKSLTAAEGGDLKSLRGLTGLYVRTLDLALSVPGIILILAFSMLIGTQVVYGKFGKGVEFFPSIEPEAATVLVHARGNMSIFEKDALVREVESRIIGLDGLRTIYTRTGKASGGAFGGDMAEDVVGQIQIEFTEWDTRPKASAILATIRERTADIAGIHIETQEMESGPPGGKNIQIQLASRFPEALPGAVEMILAGLDELGGFIDIEDSRPLPGLQWELQIDRAQASKFGLDLSTVGQYIRMLTNGLRVAGYRPDDSNDEVDIVLRFPMDDRTLDQLDRLRVAGPDGPVAVSSFMQRVPKDAVGNINRSGQQRIMTVKANVAEGANIAARVAEIQGWLVENRDRLDPRVTYTFKGEDEDQREASTFLMKAFVVALFVMAIILVTQFNSFYSALLILSAVILSTIGVFLGLLVTQQPFGIVMSGIGVIALAGIVVNNNIILIDTFDTIRRDYPQYSVREAILRTGAQRLRPVLLTTCTTILGLLPMVLQVNIDFIARDVSYGAPSTQWWVQLSTAISFGLAFATVLTLLVTPCALMFRARVGVLFRRFVWRRKKAGAF